MEASTQILEAFIRALFATQWAVALGFATPLGIWVYRNHKRIAEIDTWGEAKVVAAPVVVVLAGGIAAGLDWQTILLMSVMKLAIGLGMNSGTAALPARKPKPEGNKPVGPKSTALIVLLLASLAMAPMGCTAAQFASAMSHISRGSAWLAALVDAGESGSKVYFARHPSPSKEARVTQAIHATRKAMAALDKAIAGAESANASEWGEARKNAIGVYGELVALLTELGVMEGKPPADGAEVEDAPMPEPFELATVAEVEARL